MCGKFTAMFSYAEVHAFSQPLNCDSAEREAEKDWEVTFRVMSNVPVHIWDRQSQQRRVVAMRWGFPHPTDWRRPQPIHARSETIEVTKAFSNAFLDGQRGIVLVKTFNEAPDENGKSGPQHTITPDTNKSGIAMVWRRFEIGAPVPLIACVMVTVPANKLIAALPTDRMPAILDPANWTKWTGEEPASVDELKAMLKTAEGVRWRMQKEDRPRKPRT